MSVTLYCYVDQGRVEVCDDCSFTKAFDVSVGVDDVFMAPNTHEHAEEYLLVHSSTEPRDAESEATQS
jgi:glutaredoxin